jgi:hypothetical protein
VDPPTAERAAETLADVLDDSPGPAAQACERILELSEGAEPRALEKMIEVVRAQGPPPPPPCRELLRSLCRRPEPWLRSAASEALAELKVDEAESC